MDHYEEWKNRVRRAKTQAVGLASSHLITTCATIAALMLFVGLGSRVLPSAFGWAPLPDTASSLSVAFVLNVAIILFGWRRSKDLKQALDAYEEADRTARRNANTDPMTGLSNRRELIGSLEDALKKTTEMIAAMDTPEQKQIRLEAIKAMRSERAQQYMTQVERFIRAEIER